MATDSPAPLAMAGTSSGLGSSSSDPNGAEEEAGDPMPLLRPSATTQATVPVSRPGPPISLRARLSSLSDYPSGDADSLVILDELLDDIRRSRTASLSSTPTLSSDCENESVIQCDEGRRSEAELRAMGMLELRTLRDTLQQEVDCVSELLVRLLHVKDKKAIRITRQHQKLSTILRNYAEENGMSSDLRFSLTPPENSRDYPKWVAGWKVLSRIPKGMPKHWRKQLWCSLASEGTRGLDWPHILQSTFIEYSTPEDESLGVQIVKDLHRTGNTGFTTEEEHAVLKRVLLAYARFNKSTGYCQGFNIIAAVILKVVEFDEEMALKVMVYLIDYLLPENYFAENLYALSADMAAFRDLLRHYLPELSDHMDDLQRASSGPVRKSYSSEDPPDTESIRGYEPPLANVFTMQWFLTIFATALPRKATRMVWDAIFLEGTEVLQYTGIAILAIMERDLLRTATTADFYSTMAQLGERLRKAQLLPSTEFMQVVYAVKDSAMAHNGEIPDIKKLRERYTYNIYPCAQPFSSPETSLEVNTDGSKQCPLPSRGGSYLFGRQKGTRSQNGTHPSHSVDSPLSNRRVTGDDGREEVTGSFEQLPMDTQLKKLHEHYTQVARQPSSITCNMALAPPRARAVCPQVKTTISYLDFKTVPYAADVPPEILHRSMEQSGSRTLETLHKQRRKTFTISFAQSDSNSSPKSRNNHSDSLRPVRYEHSKVSKRE